MGLTTDISSNDQNNILRRDYKITGICLETNLRVTKRHVVVSLSKKILKILSSASDRTQPRGGGIINNLDRNKIIVPVKNDKLYHIRDLDKLSNEISQLLGWKLNLVPGKERQFFVRMTLISSDSVNQHCSRMFSYSSDRSDRAIIEYGKLLSLLVHYDSLGHVIPLDMAGNANLLLKMINDVNLD